MVEQQRRRVEQEMTTLVNELDKQYLRKMQANMHRCAARCCDDTMVSVERVQNCIEHCSVPLNQSQQYVQDELSGLQNRLQRCVMDCNDDIKSKMGPNPNESDVNKYSLMFESCATKCVDKHVELIPTMLKTMKSVLSKQSKETI